MSLSHNQFNLTMLPPGSEFTAQIDRLGVVSEYGGPVALRYLSEHTGLAGGAVAGERIPDIDAPNYYAARPAVIPHVQDPEPGSPEAFENLRRLKEAALARARQQRIAAEEAEARRQQQQDQQG